MFARRTRWNLAPNRLTELAESRRARGLEVLDLTESNPTRAGIAYPGERIRAAIAGPEVLAYAPEALGMRSAREAVAAHLAEAGTLVDPGRLVLTASTSEAYGWLFKLLCDPGDEVLIPRPSYPLFEYLTALEEVAVVPYRLAWDGEWHVDLPTVRQALTERTRAVLAVSPNNPTGNPLSGPERASFSALCAEHGLALISDEVFLEYPTRPGQRLASVLTGDPPALTFALSGLSKAAGLPQLKLGWIAVGGPEELVRPALERLEVIADTYLSVNTPVQVAAPELFAAGREVRHAILTRVRENRERLARACAGEVPYRLLPAVAGWYAILAVPRTVPDEEWAARLLDEDGVLVQPGFFFDMPGDGFLVVSLLTDPVVLMKGAERMLRRLASGPGDNRALE